MAHTNMSSNETSSNRISYGDTISFEYILAIDDFGFDSFLKDSRTKAVASKTNCLVELTTRVLNKRINLYRWTKYAIIKVTGPDEGSINQCLRLIERQFPIFLHRKEYSRRANVTIFTNEISLPDNIPGQTKIARSGSTMSCCQGLAVRSPFVNDELRTPGKTIWKTKKSEKEGRYASALPMHRNVQPPLFVNASRMTSFDSASTKFSSNEIFGLLGTLSKNVQSYGRNPDAENVTVRVSMDNVDKDAKQSQTTFQKNMDRDVKKSSKRSGKSVSERNPIKRSETGASLYDYKKMMTRSHTSVEDKTNIYIEINAKRSGDKVQCIDDVLVGSGQLSNKKPVLLGDLTLDASIEKMHYANESKVMTLVAGIPAFNKDSHTTPYRQRYVRRNFATNEKIVDPEIEDMPVDVMQVGDEYDRSLADVDKYLDSESTVLSMVPHKSRYSTGLKASVSKLQREYQTLVGGSPYNDKNVLINVGITSASSTVELHYSTESYVEPANGDDDLDLDNDSSLGRRSDVESKSTRMSKSPAKNSRYGNASQRSDMSSVADRSTDTSRRSCDRFERHHSTQVASAAKESLAISRGRKIANQRGKSKVLGDASRQGTQRESKNRQSDVTKARSKQMSSKHRGENNDSDRDDDSQLSLSVSVHSNDTYSETNVKANIQRSKTQAAGEKAMKTSSRQKKSVSPTIPKSSTTSHVKKSKVPLEIHRPDSPLHSTSQVSISVSYQSSESVSETNFKADVQSSRNRESKQIESSPKRKAKENYLDNSYDSKKIDSQANVGSQLSISITVQSSESYSEADIEDNVPQYVSENIPVGRHQGGKVDKDMSSVESRHISVSIIKQNSEESDQSVEVNVVVTGPIQDRVDQISEESVSPIVQELIERPTVSSTSININTIHSKSPMMGQSQNIIPIPQKPLLSTGTVHRSLSLSHDEVSTTLSFAIQKFDERDSEQMSALLEYHHSTKSSEGLMYLSDFQKNEMEFKLGDVPVQQNRPTITDSKQVSRRDPVMQSTTEVSIQKLSGMKLNVSVSHSSTESASGVYVKGINDSPNLTLSKTENELEDSEIAKLIVDRMKSTISGPLIIMFEGRNIYSTGAMSLAIKPTGESLQDCNYDFESTNYVISVKYVDNSLRNVKKSARSRVA